MKKIRRLAILAMIGIFTAAGTAAAGGPPQSNAPDANLPARNAPRLFTPEQLGELLKARHKSVVQTGEGDATTFNLSKLTAAGRRKRFPHRSCGKTPSSGLCCPHLG